MYCFMFSQRQELNLSLDLDRGSSERSTDERVRSSLAFFFSGIGISKQDSLRRHLRIPAQTGGRSGKIGVRKFRDWSVR